jgi:hypothetical protein
MESNKNLIETMSELSGRYFAISGAIRPMYQAFTADGKSFFMMAPRFPKDQAIKIVKAIFAEKKIVSYVFVDEAWMVAASAKNADVTREVMAAKSVSEHPDRREVVLMIAEGPDGTWQGVRDIVRKDGMKPTLGPLESYPVECGEGRYYGLLPMPEGSKVQ